MANIVEAIGYSVGRVHVGLIGYLVALFREENRERSHRPADLGGVELRLQTTILVLQARQLGVLANRLILIVLGGEFRLIVGLLRDTGSQRKRERDGAERGAEHGLVHRNHPLP